MLSQSDIRNHLLSRFSPEGFHLLAAHLEPMAFPRQFQFSQPNEKPEYSYFLNSGIGSIVALTPEGQGAEVGIFGWEGMTPASAAAGPSTDPFNIFMQIAGDGYRVPMAVLAEACIECRPLERALVCYAHTLTIQTAYTAASNAIHHIDERLARWILMCHDRTDGDEIHLTHDFLSIMLAVRRPSVTTALHVLEGNRFIYSERGTVTMRDRRALEAFAFDAYGAPEKEYVRLIGAIK